MEEIDEATNFTLPDPLTVAVIGAGYKVLNKQKEIIMILVFGFFFLKVLCLTSTKILRVSHFH